MSTDDEGGTVQDDPELAMFVLILKAIDDTPDADAQANAVIDALQANQDIVNNWWISLDPEDDDDLAAIPPFAQDRVAEHYGWADDGKPACDVFPCKHGWDNRDSLTVVVTQRDTYKTALQDARDWVNATFGLVNDFSGLKRILSVLDEPQS